MSTTGSGSLEKESLLGNEAKVTIVDSVKQNIHLLAVVILLASCIALDAALIAKNVNELSSIQDRKEGARLGATASSGMLGLANEVLMRANKSDVVSSELNIAVSALASSSLMNATARDTLQFLLQVSRQTLLTNTPAIIASYFDVLNALQQFAFSAIKMASDTASQNQLGLVCLGSHFHRLGNQLVLMNEFVTPSWGKGEYLAFLGSLDTAACGTLLPEALVDQEEAQILKGAPGVSSPSPAVYGILGANDFDANAAELVDRATQVDGLVRMLSTITLDNFAMQERSAINSLGFACAALAVLCCLIFAAPKLSQNMDASRSDIRNIFRVIEATVKLINKYSQVLTTCSVRDGEWKQQDNSFLWKIVEFVQRVRPYIPQSSFGDIENVPITGQSAGSKGSMRHDTASAAQAIRELRLRDLRPDMGMQTVSGTIMCLSLSPFHREVDAVGDAAQQDVVKDRISTFLKTVESCINGTTGVIHTIAGDNVIALWNVTSSTSTPHVCAVHSALQLVKSLGSEMNISVGIAQSFLLAGNVEISKRKQLAACGPAIALAERLEGCNQAHKTNIMIDSQCAEAVSNTVIAEYDFTVRPVVLLRVNDNADDFITGFAVYTYRIRQEKLKAWNVVFKELGSKLHAGAYAEAMLDVEEYKTKHATETSSKAGGRNRNAVDRTAESWRRNLMAAIRVKESSLRHATEFGV